MNTILCKGMNMAYVIVTTHVWIYAFVFIVRL